MGKKDQKQSQNEQKKVLVPLNKDQQQRSKSTDSVAEFIRKRSEEAKQRGKKKISYTISYSRF